MVGDKSSTMTCMSPVSFNEPMPWTLKLFPVRTMSGCALPTSTTLNKSAPVNAKAAVAPTLCVKWSWSGETSDVQKTSENALEFCHVSEGLYATWPFMSRTTATSAATNAVPAIAERSTRNLAIVLSDGWRRVMTDFPAFICGRRVNLYGNANPAGSKQQAPINDGCIYTHMSTQVA